MAGLARDGVAWIDGKTELRLDSRGWAAADFALTPHEVRYYQIT